MNFAIKQIEKFPNGLAIKWNDDRDSFIDFIILRDNCPCAHCSGESDIYGNIYKGPKIKKMGSAYELVNVIKIGHYAIRPTWNDNHSDGIFTFDLLRKLDLSE
tara:strand:+ start:236 stop:544 length:309 start_codon:yes stop_codon:yes gene_type:complete